VTRDTRTHKQRNRATRQEALREQLALQKHEEKAVEIIKDLIDADNEYDSLMIRRKEIALNGHLKLMAKYIPDLKAQEITGPDGNEITLQIARKRFD